MLHTQLCLMMSSQESVCTRSSGISIIRVTHYTNRNARFQAGLSITAMYFQPKSRKTFASTAFTAVAEQNMMGLTNNSFLMVSRGPMEMLSHVSPHVTNHKLERQLERPTVSNLFPTNANY